MEFIFKVFGSNVIIFGGSFIYIYMMFFIYKFVFNERYARGKENGFFGYGCKHAYDMRVDQEFTFIVDLSYVMLWPVCCAIHIIVKIFCLFIPCAIKFFDKITPSVKIVKQED